MKLVHQLFGFEKPVERISIDAVVEGIWRIFENLEVPCEASYALSKIALQHYKEGRGKGIFSLFYSPKGERAIRFWDAGNREEFLKNELRFIELKKCDKNDDRLDWKSDLYAFDPEVEYILNIYWINRFTPKNILETIVNFKISRRFPLWQKPQKITRLKRYST